MHQDYQHQANPNVDLDLLAKGTCLVTVKGNTNPGSIQIKL